MEPFVSWPSVILVRAGGSEAKESAPKREQRKRQRQRHLKIAIPLMSLSGSCKSAQCADARSENMAAIAR